jgi:predicted nucleic acid-binding Zn finger protein
VVYKPLDLKEPTVDAHPRLIVSREHALGTRYPAALQFLADVVDGGKPACRHIRSVDPSDVASRTVRD